MTHRNCVLNWRIFCEVFRFLFTERDTEDFVDVSCVKKNGDSYFSELQPNWKLELSFVTLAKLSLELLHSRKKYSSHD